MQHLHPIGQIRQNPANPEQWESRPVHVPLLEDELIPFTLHEPPGAEGYPPDVAEAVNAFLSLGVVDRAAAGERISSHCGKRADVWMHVKPTGIHVERDAANRQVHVRITLCCDWDAARGVEFVYRHGAKLVVLRRIVGCR